MPYDPRNLNDAQAAFAAYATNAFVPPPAPPPVYPNMYGSYAANGASPLITPPPPPMLNYAAANSYQLPYSTAQIASSMQGQHAFNYPGMQYLTNPNLAAFGSYPSAQMPSSGFRTRPPPPVRLFPPMPEQSLFSRQEVMGYNYGGQEARYNAGLGIAGLDAGVSMAATGIGAAAGALIGGRFGHADAGMFLGSVLGNSIPGIHRAASFALRPAIRDYAYAARLGASSQRYTVGGSEMSPLGQGLTMPGAMHVAQGAGNIAAMSGGIFNRRDVINMTQMSGDSGLLDMTRNSDQILEQMKNISKVVSVFAKITGDPDIRNSIKLMGNMRAMGGNLSDMTMAMQGFDRYSRMAGTSVKNLIQEGAMPGAFMYQNAGLSGITGMQAGAYARAQAQQAVNTGSVSTLQLGLLGGVSGMAQRNMQTSAAFLGGSGLQMLIPGMVKQGKNGFELDEKKIHAFLSGKTDITSMISGGAHNISNLKGIQNIQAQMPELQSQFASMVGPEGTQLAMLRLGDMIRKQMGGNINMTTAMQMLGMQPTEARAFMNQMRNPATYKNMISQLKLEDLRRQKEDSERIKQMPSYWGHAFTKHIGNPASGVFEDLLPHMFQAVGKTFASYEQKERNKAMGINETDFSDISPEISTKDAIRIFKAGNHNATLARTTGLGDRWNYWKKDAGIDRASIATAEAFSTSGERTRSMLERGALDLVSGPLAVLPATRTYLGGVVNKAVYGHRLDAAFQKEARIHLNRNSQAFARYKFRSSQLNSAAEDSAEAKLKQLGLSDAEVAKFQSTMAKGLVNQGNSQFASNIGDAPQIALEQALQTITDPSKQAEIKAALQSDVNFRDQTNAGAYQQAHDMDSAATERLTNRIIGAGNQVNSISNLANAKDLHARVRDENRGAMAGMLNNDKSNAGTAAHFRFVHNFDFLTRADEDSKQMQILTNKAGGNKDIVAYAMMSMQGGHDDELRKLRGRLSKKDFDKASALAESVTSAPEYSDLRTAVSHGSRLTENSIGETVDALQKTRSAEMLQMEFAEASKESGHKVSSLEELGKVYKVSTTGTDWQDKVFQAAAIHTDFSKMDDVTSDVAKTGAQGSKTSKDQISDIADAAATFADTTEDFSSGVDVFSKAAGTFADAVNRNPTITDLVSALKNARGG